MLPGFPNLLHIPLRWAAVSKLGIPCHPQDSESLFSSSLRRSWWSCVDFDDDLVTAERFDQSRTLECRDLLQW